MKYFIILAVVTVLILSIYLWSLERQQAKISWGPKINLSQNKNSALFIIDIQKDLTTKEGKSPLDISQTDSLILKLNKLISLANNKGWLICYIQNEYEKNWIFNKLTNESMLANSEGVKFDNRLKQLNNGIFIKKHIRDAFSNKKLDSVLKINQVGNLYITGIDAKYCVNSTIEAGRLRNYNISYIKELVATKKKEELSKLTERWEEKGVREIKLYHLIEELSKN